MKSLEEKLGYTFQDRGLLDNALTHSSCANESRGKLQSNERLEFLGDSILGMVVADHLYRNHPDRLSRPTLWRRCWPPSIWTEASDRPVRSSKSIS